MTTFEWFQAVTVTGSLLFVAVQSWLMRRAVEEQRNQLRVQSCLQVWQAHVQTCHLSMATANDDAARELNRMSPYYSLELTGARRAHYADAAMDIYECISLMADLGILDAEVARVWRDSVPYEMQNPHLREHWRRFHAQTNAGAMPQGIYLKTFVELVERSIRRHHPPTNGADSGASKSMAGGGAG